MTPFVLSDQDAEADARLPVAFPAKLMEAEQSRGGAGAERGYQGALRQAVQGVTLRRMSIANASTKGLPRDGPFFARTDLRRNHLSAKLFPQTGRIVGVPKGTFVTAMIYFTAGSRRQVHFDG
jgi:hypothetical protein